MDRTQRRTQQVQRKENRMCKGPGAGLRLVFRKQ
jgi:hypothetical protein